MEAPLKARIEAIKYQIDALSYVFFHHDNQEDFLDEKDSACHSLDDLLEIIERDRAYKALQEQLLPI